MSPMELRDVFARVARGEGSAHDNAVDAYWQARALVAYWRQRRQTNDSDENRGALGRALQAQAEAEVAMEAAYEAEVLDWRGSTKL